MILHVATGNAKKLAELERVLKEDGIENITLLPTGETLGYPEPEENGRTFADNALIKARAGAAATGYVTLADDSGITVDELNGMPGVLSARWCGEHGNDEGNNKLLLAQMEHAPLERRHAAFVCVVALVTPDGEEFIEKGVWEGRLTRTPAGENGFGYDPLFVPAEEDEKETPRTSAQLSAAEKDAISHRGKALAALVPALRYVAEKYANEGE
ncbi:MAG: RdgB/HAM1 family non-canonical purine NTP pyrophosphatase [Corynebacterium sp.]|nr:RdgB/HAM1 family non-canonical purine NTP pyrophosphatase [Corynebacterium sp.]